MPHPGKGSNKKLVFVGHDYTTRGGRKPKFRKAISTMLKSLDYNSIYADEKRLHPTVLTDIKEKIKISDFCIFDLTGYKSNKQLEKLQKLFKPESSKQLEQIRQTLDKFFKKEKLGKNLNVILEIGMSIGLDRQVFVAYKEGCIDFDKELSDFLGNYRYPYKTYKELVKELREDIRYLTH